MDDPKVKISSMAFLTIVHSSWLEKKKKLMIMVMIMMMMMMVVKIIKANNQDTVAI